MARRASRRRLWDRMDPIALVKIVVTAALTAGAAALAVWLSKRPNRAKKAPGRVRMPKLVPVVGWLFIAVGALMCLVAFTSPPDDDALAMRIASVAILVAGVAFLAMYRNFYVIAGADEVFFRSIWGVEKHIRYVDIDRYEMVERNGQQILHVHASTGASLNANPRMYALEPLLSAIAFFQQMGRWPLPGEPRPQIAWQP